MPLSEDEQRILHQIEQQFYESDPNFAGELETHSLYVHHLRRMKWAALGFFVGVSVMVASLWKAQSSVLIAFAGFVIMLASVLWFDHNLRKLGRAGLAQLSESIRATGIREYLGSSGQRFRDRFRQSDD